jgi:hypothetical protein
VEPDGSEVIRTGITVASAAVLTETAPMMGVAEPAGVVPGAGGAQAVKTVTRQSTSNKGRRVIGSSPIETKH